MRRVGELPWRKFALSVPSSLLILLCLGVVCGLASTACVGPVSSVDKLVHTTRATVRVGVPVPACQQA